ncbi:MAG: zinc-binding dehydrogenase, partial [Actinomycetota bacterium]
GRGRLVIVGGEEGGRWLGGIDRNLRASLLSPFVGQRLTWFVSPERADDLADLLDLVAAGEVTPSIDRAVPLADVPTAVQDLYEGRIRGKAVVLP